MALRQRELPPVVIDHEICGAKEWHAEERHVVRVDALETVDQDFDFGVARWVFLSFVADFDVGNNEMVVGNCYVEAWGG